MARPTKSKRGKRSSESKPGRVTLRDVAVDVGVDVTTVSKVLLGGDRINVRPETRERITEAVERLGYRPNASARGLRMQRTNMIGLLLPDFTNPLYASIVRGAVLAAERAEHVMLVAGIREVDPADAYRRLVREHRIDGLIVAAAPPDGQLVQHLADDGIPHVFVNRGVPGSNRNVVLDDETGMRIVAEAFVERGHRRLGVIDAPLDLATTRSRAAALEAVCKQLGVPKPARAVGIFDPGSAYDAMTKLLSAARPPTAVFVSNAYAAIGCYAAATDLGVEIGRDAAMLTYETSEISDALRPRLASVGMPYSVLGERAVELLLAVLAGEPVSDVVVGDAPKLVVRESLSAAPTP